MNSFKRKVKEKIKIYSKEKYLDGYIKREFLTDDGTAEIFLNINDKDELFDSYTVGEQKDLRKDIYDFIEEKSSMLGNEIPIRLDIDGCSFTAREQEIIKHILKEHYAIELYKIQKEFFHHINKTISLIVLGILSFILYMFFSYFTNNDYSLIIFSFISSFSLWEAMDSFIYTMSEIRNNREAITQNLLMDVEFIQKK